MKLNISNAGIYNQTKYEILDVLDSLREAKNACMMSPGSFSCSGYVDSLSSKISGFINRINSLQYAIEKTEKRYNDFLIDKKQEVSNLNEQILKERVGLSTRFNNASNKYFIGGKLTLDPTSMLVFNQIANVSSVVSKDLNNRDESSMVNEHMRERQQREAMFAANQRTPKSM